MVGLIALEVLCLFSSKLTSSKQGTKRQSQSMKFINENWNAFYSFLITRIVAHNWAACIRLEITLHLCMCGSVCVYMHYHTVCVCECLCVQKELGKDKHTKRKRRSWMWRKKWYQERTEKTVNWKTRWGEIWSNIKSIFLWYYIAPFRLYRELHLLSVSCASVVRRPSVPHQLHLHNLNKHTLHQNDMHNFDLSS